MTLLTPAPAPGLLTTALPKFTPDMEVPIAGPAAVTKDQARIAG